MQQQRKNFPNFYLSFFFSLYDLALFAAGISFPRQSLLAVTSCYITVEKLVGCEATSLYQCNEERAEFVSTGVVVKANHFSRYYVVTQAWSNACIVGVKGVHAQFLLSRDA